MYSLHVGGNVLKFGAILLFKISSCWFLTSSGHDKMIVVWHPGEIERHQKETVSKKELDVL